MDLGEVISFFLLQVSGKGWISMRSDWWVGISPPSKLSFSPGITIPQNQRKRLTKLKKKTKKQSVWKNKSVWEFPGERFLQEDQIIIFRLRLLGPCWQSTGVVCSQVSCFPGCRIQIKSFQGNPSNINKFRVIYGYLHSLLLHTGQRGIWRG